MGRLLDEGRTGLNDLGYCLEKDISTALAAKGLPKTYVNAVVVMNAKSLELNEPSVQRS